MEIDPHNLPSEVNLLQQIVLQLLQAVEDKDQLLARLQHQLAQLLGYRYGQKRERIDENQLLMFAAQIVATSQRARWFLLLAYVPNVQEVGVAGGGNLTCSLSSCAIQCGTDFFFRFHQFSQGDLNCRTSF